jgi:hypothetical protein
MKPLTKGQREDCVFKVKAEAGMYFIREEEQGLWLPFSLLSQQLGWVFVKEGFL